MKLLSAPAVGGGGHAMDLVVSLIASLAANVVTYLVCKWLEEK